MLACRGSHRCTETYQGKISINLIFEARPQKSSLTCAIGAHIEFAEGKHLLGFGQSQAFPIVGKAWLCHSFLLRLARRFSIF